MNGVPDFQQREKIRLRIGESFVGGGGGVLLVERALARILNAQAGGDDQQFARGMFVLRLEQHAAQRGINRQPREVFAERRQGALFIQRAQFLQQRVAAGDGSGRGRLHERKRLNVAQAERLHAQNDFGQIGALDFRLRVRRTRQRNPPPHRAGCKRLPARGPRGLCAGWRCSAKPARPAAVWCACADCNG